MMAFSALTRFLVWTALVVGLIVGAARLVAIRWIRLPTNDPVFETSLLPTLEGGDLIVLWRLAKPSFGDLVLCPEPNFPERYVIGRIIGEAGDNVHFENGRPLVNQRPFVIERGCDPSTFSFLHPNGSNELVTQNCSWEAVGNQLHMTGQLGNFKITPEDRDFDVPAGHWFLASDNRLFPYDSRDYGFVETSSCKELVVARLVSRRGWTDVARRLSYIQ